MITHWQIKELSNITGVSVRTLHHYDRIDLLKPSVRQANGYRLYTKNDLIKLQQIIALKFFGFTLSEIKALPNIKKDMIQHFSMQSEILKKKAQSLIEASNALESVIMDCKKSRNVPWKKIITLIEVYKMSEQIEETWLRNILSADEMEQYASFEKDLRTRFNAQEKEAFEENWAQLVKDIESNINKDPKSEIGEMLSERCTHLINGLYPREFRWIKSKIWEKGFKEGKAEKEHKISREAVEWLDKAMDAYWRKRICTILNNEESKDDSEVQKEWEQCVDDMYGDNPELRHDLELAVLENETISDKAKKWLRETYKL